MRTSSFWGIATNWGFNPLSGLADDLAMNVADEQTVTHRSSTNTIDSLPIRGDDTIAIGDAP